MLRKLYQTRKCTPQHIRSRLLKSYLSHVLLNDCTVKNDLMLNTTPLQDMSMVLKGSKAVLLFRNRCIVWSWETFLKSNNLYYYIKLSTLKHQIVFTQNYDLEELQEEYCPFLRDTTY